MDITNLRLGTFKLIVKYLLEKARNHNGNFEHLKITYSWVKLETDEDVFDLLKQGSGGKYIKEIMYGREG